MPRLTDEQRAMRRTGLGSSDIAGLLGISPYKDDGPWRVYMDKVGTSEDDEEETIAHRLGHELEVVCRRLYEEQFPGVTVPGSTVRHPVETFALATLDRRIPSMRRGVECKAVGSWMTKHWSVSREDGIPRYVRVQANWQMFVCDLDEMDVAAILGGTDFRVWRIQRDQLLIEQLVPMAREFWQRIEARIPPPCDATIHCRAWLDEKYPEHHGAKLVGPCESDEAEAATYIDALTNEKAQAKRKTAAINRLLLACGDAPGIEGETWKLTWKKGADGKRRARFTVKGKGKGDQDDDGKSDADDS